MEDGKRSKELVKDKDVWLELDVPKFDQSIPLLAYVCIGSIFVKGLLVENGYARTACYPPNVEYYHYFRHLGKESQEKGLGIWEKIATERCPQEMREERGYRKVHTILYYVDKDNPQGPYP